ncbi:MAG TPA: thioredoxin-dependent thiol peroxidase [Candidatus Limnocylindria bacterium]|jgi:peroxiredoxin Q/BCP|nr:thioredoxin-dependent thiol peroxidase [Candidatus Limnocylindria bacterium]
MSSVKPSVGELAPDFSLEADDGSTVSRDSLLGERYVLYFYPKDDTPGCTAQACSLRDNFGRVMDTGIRVFGVSPDSVKSHVKFRAKYDLPYPLLADVGHQVADAFGVWVDKKYMGRSYQGVERSSFIVGPDGRIEHVLERVKPMEHVDLVLEALAA